MVEVRDLALLQDGARMLHRVQVWRHAWPHHHLWPQLLQQGTCHLGGVFGAVIVLEYYPAAQLEKGGDHPLLQYGCIHNSFNLNLNSSSQCRQHSCSSRPWHSHHQSNVVWTEATTLAVDPNCGSKLNLPMNWDWLLQINHDKSGARETAAL